MLMHCPAIDCDRGEDKNKHKLETSFELGNLFNGLIILKLFKK